MNLTISADDADLTLALEGWSPPPSCETLYVDAPNVRKCVNLFLQSPVNCRVVFRFPDQPINMAGLFSLCGDLQHQPVIEGNPTATSLAAAFKVNRQCRYSMHWLAPITSGCRDYRQMFWGAINYSGNGVQGFDFSNVTSPLGMRNFFGGGSAMRTQYYDLLIQEWHDLLEQDRLPLPMSPVDMGHSVYSPYVADMRLALIESGWDIQDGGEVPIDLSPLEVAFSEAVDSRLDDGQFPGTIDLSPVCRTMRGGIAITPRHTLHVRHYMPPVGQPIKLWNGEEARVQEIERGHWDIAIATLDRDCDVAPALVMPRNWQELMPNASGPPCSYPAGTRPPLLIFNRNNKIGIWDLSFISTSKPQAQPQESAEPDRAAHHMGMASGDSGSPVCFVYRDRLVAAWSVANSDGSGVWLAGVRDWADAVVAQTGHTLTELKL